MWNSRASPSGRPPRYRSRLRPSGVETASRSSSRRAWAHGSPRSGYHGRQRDHRPERLHPPPRPLEFSLLDGLGRITELVDSAAQQGFDSLALTDHGALYGAVAFCEACRTWNIKPIIGVETYIARRAMADKEGKADAQPFHLVLLARDWIGYLNLCRLISDAHIDGYYYKPRIDPRAPRAPQRGPYRPVRTCLNGEVPRALEVEDWELARKLAGEYGDIFGPDGFFLELEDHGLPEQRRLNEQLLRLAPMLVSRSSRRTICTTCGASSPRRMTCCCALGRATTSTRRTGCGLSRPSST